MGNLPRLLGSGPFKPRATGSNPVRPTLLFIAAVPGHLTGEHNAARQFSRAACVIQEATMGELSV